MKIWMYGSLITNESKHGQHMIWSYPCAMIFLIGSTQQNSPNQNNFGCWVMDVHVVGLGMFWFVYNIHLTKILNMTRVLDLVWMVANILACPCPFANSSALFLPTLAKSQSISWPKFWLATFLVWWAKTKHTLHANFGWVWKTEILKI